MVKSMGYTIGNSPVRKKGSETAYTGVFEPGIASYIQISLLLPRKRSGWKVFSRCRTPYSYIRILSILFAEAVISPFDLLPDVIRNSCIKNQVSCSLSPLCEVRYIRSVKPFHCFFKLLQNSTCLQHMPVSTGSN